MRDVLPVNLFPTTIILKFILALRLKTIELFFGLCMRDILLFNNLINYCSKSRNLGLSSSINYTCQIFSAKILLISL